MGRLLKSTRPSNHVTQFKKMSSISLGGKFEFQKYLTLLGPVRPPNVKYYGETQHHDEEGGHTKIKS